MKNMKRAIFLVGICGWLFSCAENKSNTEQTEAVTDTTSNLTTNSGAAGTGGVGAGFGAGGATIDTVTSPGKMPDTAKQHK